MIFKLLNQLLFSACTRAPAREVHQGRPASAAGQREQHGGHPGRALRVRVRGWILQLLTIPGWTSRS